MARLISKGFQLRFKIHHSLGIISTQGVILYVGTLFYCMVYPPKVMTVAFSATVTF